jgi:hypothetical protein
MPSRVLVAGALAAKPGNGGEAWVRISWARALSQLGYSVRFVEQLDAASPAAREWFDTVVGWAGLEGRAVLVAGDSDDDLATAIEWAESAEFLVNISGNIRRDDLLERTRRRVYVDLDPGYTQVWHEQGLLGPILEQHHFHGTVGLCIGRPGCTIPTGELRWMPIVPPTCLDDWADESPARAGRFTTVAAFRGGYGRLEHLGVAYGLKAHEFRRFVDIPRHVDWEVEVALAIDAADETDRERMVAHGWHLVDPIDVAATPDAFRSYVLGSSAELSVAQGAYVTTQSGWISDRSLRYLATGRPVLVQDTALGRAVPTGAGLNTFCTLDDASTRARQIAEHYEDQCRAARAWAAEFASPMAALTPLLERVGVSP